MNVLSILLPLFAIGAVWLARGAINYCVWAVPVALSVLLFASVFVATRTGETEEDRVEDLIPKRVLHEHEEAAERFLVLAGIVAAVAGVAMGARHRRIGGALVYEYNAGAAYTAEPDTR